MKNYLKDKLAVLIFFPIMGTISLFTLETPVWNWIVPIFFYGMALGVFLYGFKK